MKKMRSQDGFTLLFAVLVASLLLSIGISIFNITLRELLLSSSARESQFAVYAADSGIECAFYWDFNGGAFATSTAARSILCNDQTLEFTVGSTYPASVSFTLQFAPETYCSIVTVSKSLVTFGGQQSVQTTVESHGYNTCESGNTRRVERILKATY